MVPSAKHINRMTGTDIMNLLLDLQDKGHDLEKVRFNYTYNCNNSRYADDINFISFATFSGLDKTLTITLASKNGQEEYEVGEIERNVKQFLKSITQ